MQSDQYSKIFPDCQLDRSSKAKDYFRTTMDGEFLATAASSGTATGSGADLFCIDDPIKDREQAYSKLQRETLYDYYRAVALTRLQPGGRILITNTRWSDADLSGWLLDPEAQERVDPRWEILHMPALAMQDQCLPPSMGGRLWRKEGDPLWPEYWTKESLERTRIDKGQWDWHAQYQGTPSAIEGIYYLKKWFKRYDFNPYLLAMPDFPAIKTAPYVVVQSIDCAQKPGEDNDYTPA